MSETAERELTHGPLGRARLVIVALACLFNVVAVAGTNYSVHRFVRQILLGLHVTFDTLNFDSYDAVNNAIWLAPTIAVILLRKYVYVAVLYVLVLFPILLGRVYFVLPNSWTGDSGFHRKGDWSVWAQTFVGATSLVVIAIWVGAQAILTYNAIVGSRTQPPVLSKD